MNSDIASHSLASPAFASAHPCGHWQGVRRIAMMIGVLSCAVVVGCDDGGDAADDGPAASAARADSFVATPAGPAPGTVDREGARPGAVRVLGAADADCPLTGEWRACSVEDRFVRAGLAPQRADSTPAVPDGAREAWRYWLGDAEVQVYLFTDEASRARTVESAGNAMGEAPTLDAAIGANRATVASGNLFAVVHGHRPRQVERIVLSLSAALPRP